MQPSDGTKPTIQDSVVGRDMHTGNVIHNHYHLPPAPQPVQQPPPQTVIYSPNPPQGAPYQHNPQQVFIPYKKKLIICLTRTYQKELKTLQEKLP